MFLGSLLPDAADDARFIDFCAYYAGAFRVSSPSLEAHIRACVVPGQGRIARVALKGALGYTLFLGQYDSAHLTQL